MMSSAMPTLTSLILLLIIQKSQTRPADSSNTNFIVEAGDVAISNDGNGYEDLVEKRIEKTCENNFSNDVESNKLHSDLGSTKHEDLLLSETTSSVNTDDRPPENQGSAQINERSFPESRVEKESQTPNDIRESQQSATIVSSYTYPVGSKPAKPSGGSGKPTGTAPGQDKPPGTQASPDTSPPQENPLAAQDGEFNPSLFGFSGSPVGQKPPSYPGFGTYKPGPPFVGSVPVSPSAGFTMFPGFMRPPLGYPQVFPPLSTLIGSKPFDGLGTPVGGFGSYPGNVPSFNLQPGPVSFLQGHDDNDHWIPLLGYVV